MPTGHTYKVENGEIDTVKDFALECIKSFGIMTRMYGSELKRIGRNYVLDDVVKKYEKELSEWESRQHTREEAEAEYESSILPIIESKRERMLEKLKTERGRCESLLKKVNEWEPDEDYVFLKKYMIEQLKETIDDDLFEIPETEFDKEQFIQDYINGTQIRESLEKAKKAVENDINNVENTNKFVDGFYKMFENE